MKPILFKDVEQNTDEWLQWRSGLITGSNLKHIMANYGKAFGDPAKNYAIHLAAEQLTGNVIVDPYFNEHMQRGHEQEPEARLLYEDAMFCDVANGGFFCNDIVGCSPDGLVDFRQETKKYFGAIEIKSHIPKIHYANIKRQGFNPSYKWQYIGNMLFSGVDWIDTISYCADFPTGKQIYVYRMHKGNFEDEFIMIKSRIDEFLELIKESKNIILNSEYFIRR